MCARSGGRVLATRSGAREGTSAWNRAPPKARDKGAPAAAGAGTRLAPRMNGPQPPSPPITPPRAPLPGGGRRLHENGRSAAGRRG
jgi:hypothetical protein